MCYIGGSIKHRKADVEVSTIKILPQTLNMTHLGTKAKRKLREQRVLELIESKPYGQRIKGREFLEATALRGTGSVTQFLKGMEKRGKITSHPIGKKGKFYVVGKPVKTTKLPTLPIPPPATPAVVTFDLETEAMRFAWQHPLYNNDLREFIKWFNNKETN